MSARDPMPDAAAILARLEGLARRMEVFIHSRPDSIGGANGLNAAREITPHLPALIAVAKAAKCERFLRQGIACDDTVFHALKPSARCPRCKALALLAASAEDGGTA